LPTLPVVLAQYCVPAGCIAPLPGQAFEPDEPELPELPELPEEAELPEELE
jgi:hypothetical protein